MKLVKFLQVADGMCGVDLRYGSKILDLDYMKDNDFEIEEISIIHPYTFVVTLSDHGYVDYCKHYEVE